MKGKLALDPIVSLVTLAIFSLGLFVLYSTSPIGVNISSWVDSLVARQVLFALIGVAVIYLMQFIDPQMGKTILFQIVIFVGIVLLLAGLFLFSRLVNGTHRWYLIGQFLFQPSEFAKIFAALWTAYWLTVERLPLRTKLLLGGGGILVFVVLILLQPDFGATIILLTIVASIVATWCAQFSFGKLLLMWGGFSSIAILLAVFIHWSFAFFIILPTAYVFKKSWHAGVSVVVGSLLVVAFVGGLIFAWQQKIIPKYVRDRVETFMGTAEETFQVRQSKIAIGSGGMWGKGVAQGTQTRLRFLPEYTTDFIFAAYTEERGFMGAMLLFALYLILFGRMLFMALEVHDEYAKLVIVGLTVKLAFETFVNIGMNMGVLPTKGVALPFMSYGGSSLLANSLIIALVLSLYRYESKHDTILKSMLA